MKKLNKILTFVMGGCLLVALIMMFLPAVKADEQSYNGLKLIFGYTAKQSVGGISVEKEFLEFSFMNLLTYLLALVGLVLVVLQIVKGENKIFNYAVIGCALVAAIFFFLTKNFAVLNEDIKKAYEMLNTSFTELFDLAVGPILGGVFSIVACLCGVAKVVLPMVKTK